MLKNLVCAGLLIATAALLPNTVARACGDRTLALLTGPRFGQAFKAAHPASIIIYTTGPSGAALAKDSALQKALQDAGHKLQSMSDSNSLEQALKSGKYDVVLADASAAQSLAQHAQSAPSHPVVVPVAVNPDRAMRDQAARQHTVLLKVPGKASEFFATIDQIMKQRGSQARS